MKARWLVISRWLVICGALVTQAACGARDSLRIDDGNGSGASGGGGGATGTGGAGGEAGSAPSCPVEAFAGDRTGGLRTAVDATHAFWTTVDGSLERGSLTTGEVTTLTRLGTATNAIALTETDVIAANEFQLMRVPKTGGAFESLAPGAFRPVDVAALDGTIFLLDYGGGFFSGKIYEWTPRSGLVLRFEGLDFPRAFAVDATDVVVITQGAMIDGELLSSGVLVRFSRVDFKPTVLAVDVAEPFGVEMLGETIFYGSGLSPEFTIDGRLLSIPKAGGAPTLVSNLGVEALPLAFVVDDSFAYVTLPIFDFVEQSQTSRLVKVPLSGGAPAAILEQKDRFFTEPAVSPTHLVMSVQNPTSGTLPDLDNVLVLCEP
jgi:hypothetical protein